MRLRLIATGAVIALLAVLANGCGKSPTSPASVLSTPQSLVSATLASAVTLVDETLAEDTTSVVASASYGPAGLASAQAAVKPFTWFRNVTGLTRTWSYVFSDSDSLGHPRACTATLQKHITGNFVIVPVSPADSTKPDTSRILKTLDETLTRKVLLHRLALAGGDQWKVVSLTGASVTTPGATTNIVSVRVQATSGVDTTITDPTAWITLPTVLHFGPSDSVTVTVTTSRTNDVVYIHRWDWRHRLRNNGNGTYTISWVTTAWGGWRHFGIQAMSHGSLFDDTLPFDSQAWHLPFRVTGGQPSVTYYP